jgi:NAD(P)-dependent dehydrogenase (short-subunit alcohol dehydrogenase family)
MKGRTAARRWLITGATSGLGVALARAAHGRGDVVIIAGRDADRARGIAQSLGDRALPLALDVASVAAIGPAAAEALAWRGGVDVLVNCAGRGLLGAIEEADEEEIAILFDVNLFGPLRLIRALLPSMRAQGGGWIVNFGSVAARGGVAGSGLYAASKAALASLSATLAIEAAPYGVRILTVEPGAFRTDIAGRSRVEARRRMAEYESTAGQRREGVRAIDGRQRGDPVRAAEAVLAALDAPRAPSRLVLGADAHAKAVGWAEQALAELAEWETVSLSTDLPRSPRS